MNRAQFEEYINNPTLLSAANVAELKSVTESYPWFQSAYLLYVKALSSSGHADYFDSLKKTSILVSDRKALYHLINKKTNSTTESSPQQEMTVKVSEQLTNQDHSYIQREEPTHEVQEIILTSNHSGPTSHAEIIFEKVDQPTEPTPSSPPSKKVELIVTPRDTSPKEKQTPSDKTEISPDSQDKKTETPNAFTDLNEVIVNPVVNAYIEKEILHVTEIHKPVNEAKAKGENQTFEKEKQILKETLNEPHSFSEWLKLVANTPHVNEEQKGEEKSINQPTDESPEVTEGRIKKQAIIDHLIQNEPGHIRIKESVEFFTPAKHARESNREDETLVTETLAWIYEQQGNYGKAIRSYQILSLKFPEKSVYFAGLIQKIKIKQKEK
jgi:hypothetical protein